MPPSTTTPGRRPPKRKRGEGQWKLGHREPLNPNERTKKDDDGLNVRARIENVYAKRGLRLDRPGRPARPDALVGPLHPAQPGHRRRPHRGAGARGARRPATSCCASGIDGGELTTEQLRAVGEVAQTYARDTADVTDRQNIQYHWIEIERRAGDLAAARGRRA